MTILEVVSMLLLEVPHFADAFVVSLLMVVISVAVLCGLALLLAVLLKRRPALRHSVLLSGLIGVGLIPILAVLFNAMAVPRLQVTIPLPEVPETKLQLNNPTEAEEAEARAAAAESGSRWFNARIITVVTMRMSNPEPDEHFAVDITPPRDPEWRRPIWLRQIVKAAILVWPVGSFLLLIRFAIAWLRVAIIRHTARPLPEQPYGEMLSEVMRVMNLRRLPRIRISSRVRMPVVAGLFRPQIILPETLPGSLTPDEFQQVLIHETAHAIRHDLWVVHWEAFALILFWPILLVGLMIRELSRTREELCDLYVSKFRDRHDYGQTLLKVARIANRVRPLPLATGVLYGPGQLESRIVTLLDGRRDESTKLSWKSAAGILGVFLLLTCAVSGTRLLPYYPDLGFASQPGVPSGSAPSVFESPAVNENAPDADEAAVIERLKSLGVNVDRYVGYSSPAQETVYFNENSTVNAEVFRLVKSLKNLWNLEFQYPAPATGPAMTDASMKELSELESLANLGFKNTEISEAGLRELRHLTHLVSLSIDFTELTGIGLEDLAGIESLMRITLHSTTIQDECLRGVGKLKNLMELRLSKTNITDAGVKELCDLPNLKILYLTSTQTTNACLADVAKIKTLKELGTGNIQITDGGLTELIDLPNLTTLWLSSKQTTNASLADVGKIKTLTELGLDGIQITDEALKDLSGLQNLERLSIGFTRVTDAGLKQLSRLKNLESLGAQYTPITGTGLKDLKELQNLTRLVLVGAKVTDAGLEGIGELTNLKELFLQKNSITDAGLKHLRKLKNLERIYLTETRVTNAGVKVLKKALPNANITHSSKSEVNQNSQEEPPMLEVVP